MKRSNLCDVKRPTLIAVALTSTALAVSGGYKLFQVEPWLNSTGKIIAPIVKGTPVGSYPVQMRLSPNGNFLVITNTGFRQQLTVVDTRTGGIVATKTFNSTLSGRKKESLYWGLEFVGDQLLVSRGPEDKVSAYTMGEDGSLTFKKDFLNPKREDSPLDNFVAGLVGDAGTLYALNNNSGTSTDWSGSVSEIDLASGEVRGKVRVGGFPLSAAAKRDASGKATEIYVASEQDGTVSYFRPGARIADAIPVGVNPTALLVRGDTLYVSNAGSDTISVIDTVAHKLVKTILLRPAQMRGLPCCTPLGFDLSADESTLYVALADLNAVGIVDLKKGQITGYVPVGWYPTDVKLAQDGKKLFVSNAKGVEVRIPNGKSVNKLGTYIQNIIEGTVSMIPVEAIDSQLPQLTADALSNNRVLVAANPKVPAFRNPGIKHVIYIIKENRTYDNVLGDLPGGNGDAKLCLFPREVTPNQHALAERFALLDSFFCAAEVSGDGWNWSTAGAANEYVSRNVPFNYSGRGRDYDFEGTVNGGKPENDGIHNVAAPPGGYIWDNCRKNHVSMRNYGFFVGESDAQGVKPGVPREQVMTPTLKSLAGVTDPNFNQFDMGYPDSELNQSYDLPIPGELKAFGATKAPNRFAEWKREFDGYVKSGNMPQFQMVRFCRDHTSGTSANKLSPSAMVADNDYAVGQLVEAVSHSRYWKDTVICVVEDDAQAGIDHVDCHRSIAFVISPFVKKSTHDSRFYNTDGMLRTMELILGMPPMNGFDAVADPLYVFGDRADNSDPYTAIKPSKDISGAMNTRASYRSADSARIGRYNEDSEMDVQLNDILWGAIKGKKLAAPHIVGVADDDNR